MRGDSKEPSPLSLWLKAIAWLWIAGGVVKLGLTVYSWAEYELWRSVFLLGVKVSMVISGLLLLRGLKWGPVIYFTVLLLNNVVFYSHPPQVVGVEKYFTTQAIGAAIVIPLIIMTVVTFGWNRLRWA